MGEWKWRLFKASAVIILVSMFYALFYVMGGMSYLPRNDKLWCVYGVRPYWVKKPDFTRSQYLGREIKYHGTSMNENSLLGMNLSMMPAIDDPVVKQIALDIKEQIKNVSEIKQASILLCFAQQCVQYKYDIDNWGERDFHSFPINTLAKGKGDCEDSAYIFTALAYHCGLDVITFRIPNHIGCGVCCAGTSPNNKGFWINGKFYAWCETTGTIPKVGYYERTLEDWTAYGVPREPSYTWLSGQGLQDLADEVYAQNKHLLY